MASDQPENRYGIQRLIGIVQLLQTWKRSKRKRNRRRQPTAYLEERIAHLEARQRNIKSVLRSLISEIEARMTELPIRDSVSDQVTRALAGQALPAEEIDNALRALGRKLLGNHPQYSYFNLRLRDYELAILNIKNLGYELGRALAERELRRPQSQPSSTLLKSKLCTQSDFESEWFAYWCQELHTIPFYHRKVWEFCYICQALFAAGMLAAGRMGLGFGCGAEPLPSLFAKYGVEVLATDLDASHREAEIWRSTGQHSAAVETLRRTDICPDQQLLAHIDYRPVDMNALPRELDGRFDFCWSACSFEHLGSLENGLEFVENSLLTLKHGGIAVHTTEFTFDDGDTLDNWPTVLYQKRHFVELAERLRTKGYQVADFDFDPGSGPIDRLVDVPPWSHELLAPPHAHLKLSVDGFTCTSAGLIIRT